MPCSLTSVYYPATLDHWQFQEYADSCVLTLFLLTGSALLPEFSPHFSSCKLLQNSTPLSSSREPSLNLHAFLLHPEQEEARSAVPEVNILPFVAWEIAGSEIWVTRLKSRLIWRPISLGSSLITRPFPHRIVHCHRVNYRSPPFMNMKSPSVGPIPLWLASAHNSTGQNENLKDHVVLLLLC